MPTRDVIFRILGEDAASPAFNRAAASAEGAAARISRAGDRMITSGRKLTHTFTLPILAIAGASVAAATTFNASMTRIQTQAGASARDVQYLTKRVLAMKDAQQGPNELADALYHLKSVGLDNKQAMIGLKQGMDLANVGGANLEDTVNALAGAWRTGIRGAKDFHQAAATINAILGAGNMRLPDLLGALGTGILPTAKTFGLTLKDVGAALALFTDEGVPADAAATRLRMSMSLLGAPSQAAEKQLKKIGLTGLELGNDMRKPNGLITAIGDLKKHLDDSGLSATRQSQLLSHAFGGGRSSSAILSMVNNFDVLKKKQDQVTASLGKYDHAVKVQQATPEAVFKERIANLQRAGVVIGTDLLPLAVDAVQEIAKLTSGFSHLSDGQKKFAAESALVLVALGPVLTLGGKLTKMFVAGGGAAKSAALFMAAPYRTTAEAAELSTLRTNYANAQQRADEALTAAAVARSEAGKAAAAEEAALRIAVAAESQGTALSGVATQAGLDAIEFNAAMQAEATAARTAALETAAAAERARLAMVGAMGGATRSVYGLQSAMTGLGIGLTVGVFTRGASTGTKLMTSLGAAGASAAIGWSMGGPWGAAISGLVGGLSSLATQFLGTGHSSSDASAAAIRAQRRTQEAIAATKQSVQELTGAIEADSGAWKRNTRAAIASEVIKSGAALNATQLGLDPALVTKAVLGNQNAGNKLVDTVVRAQDRALRITARGGQVPSGLASRVKYGGQLLDELAKLGVETRTATADVDRQAVAEGKLHLAMRSVSIEAHRVGTELRGSGSSAQLNRDFIRAHIQTINDAARAEYKHGASIRTVATDANNQLDAFKRLMRQYGYNAAGVERLTSRLFHLPKKVTTSTFVRTSAADTAIGVLQRRIDRITQHKIPGLSADTSFGASLIKTYQDDIDRIKQHKIPKINVDGLTALETLNKIDHYLDNLHDKRVSVTVDRSIITSNAFRRANDIPPTAAGGSLTDGYFTVGEQGGNPNSWELGYKRGADVQIWSNSDSRAMTGWDRVPGFAAGSLPTAPTAGNRHRRLKVEGGTITLRAGGRDFEGYVQELVLAELDFAAGGS